MYPILLQIGDFILPAWHVFFALAAFATGYAFLSLAAKDGYSTGPLKRLYVVTYFGGYFGARAFNIIFEEGGAAGSLSAFLTALITPGGMTFYGGFIGACILGLLYLRQLPGNRLRLVDLALVSGFLGLGIGRIGCFLNGDDYGKVVTDASGFPIGNDTFWWHLVVSFPKVLDHLPRYPVQLISTAFGVGLFWLGARLWQQRSLPDGKIALGSVAAYGVFRFIIEYFRGDPRQFFAGLAISQWVSIILLGIVLVMTIYAAITENSSPKPKV